MDNEVHIGEAICRRLEAMERSKRWLAGKINKDPSCLCKMLKNNHLDISVLLQIAIVTSEDYFAMLSAALQQRQNTEKAK